MKYKLLSYERMLKLYREYSVTFNFQCVHCGLLAFEAQDHACDPSKKIDGELYAPVFPEFLANGVLDGNKPFKIMLPDGKLLTLKIVDGDYLSIHLPGVSVVANMIQGKDEDDERPAPALASKPVPTEHMRLANELAIRFEDIVEDPSVWGGWRLKIGGLK